MLLDALLTEHDLGTAWIEQQRDVPARVATVPDPCADQPRLEYLPDADEARALFLRQGTNLGYGPAIIELIIAATAGAAVQRLDEVLQRPVNCPSATYTVPEPMTVQRTPLAFPSLENAAAAYRITKIIPKRRECIVYSGGPARLLAEGRRWADHG